MKVLIVLIVVFLLSVGIARLGTGHWHVAFSANLALFIMLCFTAIGHFKFTAGMVMMVPGPIPFKIEIVYLSGIAEIVLGLALLFPASRTMAAWILIALFVLMLPANIHAALKHISFEKANYEGVGPAYLWFRIPMQLFLIAWLWYFSIRK